VLDSASPTLAAGQVSIGPSPAVQGLINPGSTGPGQAVRVSASPGLSGPPRGAPVRNRPATPVRLGAKAAWRVPSPPAAASHALAAHAPAASPLVTVALARREKPAGSPSPALAATRSPARERIPAPGRADFPNLGTKGPATRANPPENVPAENNREWGLVFSPHLQQKRQNCHQFGATASL